MENAVVVTFVWRDMNLMERCSLRQGIKVLGHHPFFIVHPHSYGIGYLLEQYPGVKELALPDENFQSVWSYNAMMLTPDFYRHFTNYEFMLIYQTDAWVFSDQLEAWCQRGYDYVGAPWMANDKLYERTIGKYVLRLLRAIPVRHNHLHSAHIFHRVGNGGFSLRRISTMIDILERNRELIPTLMGKHERMEDVLISIILKKREKLQIPHWREALFFSWEKAPRWCMSLTKGVMPFGCHDTKGKYWDSFWKNYIKLEE